MKFGPVPIREAEGKILGHNIAGPDGRRALRKGRPLSAEDVRLLAEIGRSMVYVAELDPGDVVENQAALRLATIVRGEGIRLSSASAGRVNLLADSLGILRVNLELLDRINSEDGLTLSTRQADLPLAARKIAATLKIIPYAIPAAVLSEIDLALAGQPPVVSLDALLPRRVGLIFSSSSEARQKVLNDFEGPLRARVEALGSEVDRIEFVPLEDEAGEANLAGILKSMSSGGIELILLAGETAIMDRQDIAPRAVERAGGRVECVGVPVDPGNLLMVAYLGQIPVLGAPGCARSRKTNVIDWVLPRLLVGERLHRKTLIRMGNGGLLEDTPLRPRPRTENLD